MIKYLGSKKRLLPKILEQVQGLPDVRSVIDLFSGTSRVGHALKGAGYQVFSNDSASYAHTLATCYVQADREQWASRAELLLADLRKVRGTRGYFVDTFCRKSRFFQPKNGSRIQAIRNKIASMSLPAELEAILLTSLMEAADRVDSTVGVQMAYLKDWAPRSYNDLELRLPDLLPAALAGKGQAHRLEARATARELRADLAYLDPPYNQHRYRANYHIWDTLVRWDNPATYGVACKRVDLQHEVNDFNRKGQILGALQDVVESLDVRYLLLSYSAEGFLEIEQIRKMLEGRGPLQVIELSHPRNIQKKLGHYNPSSEWTSAKDIKSTLAGFTTEYLFLAGPTK